MGNTRVISLEHAEGLWTFSLTISEQALGHIIYACLLLNAVAGFFWVTRHAFRDTHPESIRIPRQVGYQAAQDCLRRYDREQRHIQRRRRPIRRIRRIEAGNQQPMPPLLWPRANWQRFTEEGVRANDERIRRAILRMERQAAGRSRAAVL